MSGRDGYGDPIPPGHGEPRIHEGGKVYETADVPVRPEQTDAAPWLPAPPRTTPFGTPHCPRCLYYHAPEEACRR